MIAWLCDSLAYRFKSVHIFPDQAKDQVESERARLSAELEKLAAKLDAAKEKNMEQQARIAELVEKVDRADYSHQVASQQLANQSALSEQVSRNKVWGISYAFCI